MSRLIAVAKYSNDAAQQGRTENIHWRLWQPLYGPCVTLEHSLQPAGISCMLVFAEGGKPENPEKNPRSREENQHKLNPLMASGPGIEPGLVIARRPRNSHLVLRTWKSRKVMGWPEFSGFNLTAA